MFSENKLITVLCKEDTRAQISVFNWEVISFEHNTGKNLEVCINFKNHQVYKFRLIKKQIISVNCLATKHL